MFYDRRHAGSLLAARLTAYRERRDAVVLAIPRGGVVIGSVVAAELRLPLDVILTKKIGHPENPEFAIGVVNLESAVINELALEEDALLKTYVEREIPRIRASLRARHEAYCGGRPPLALRDKTVVLVDDGVATGSTMIAAVRLARKEAAGAVVVGVPVGPVATMNRVRQLADEVVCLEEPVEFLAIGAHYARFNPVDDREAMRLMRESAENLGLAAA